jgi:tripartite-type tricarboxylate transporter receptor subunit TctC
VQAYFDAAPTAIQNRATGRIRILGVVTSARSPAIPEVPTITEGGVSGMDLPSWIAIVGPAGMAPETVSRLNGLIRQALSSPSVRDFMAKGAYEPAPSTPAELMQEMHIAYERWGTMIQQIGFEKQ